MGTAIAISTNYEGGRKKERVFETKQKNFSLFFFCFIPHFPPLVKAAAEKVTRVEMATTWLTCARAQGMRTGG
jgi:hypothetical protein